MKPFFVCTTSICWLQRAISRCVLLILSFFFTHCLLLHFRSMRISPWTHENIAWAAALLADVPFALSSKKKHTRGLKSVRSLNLSLYRYLISDQTALEDHLKWKYHIFTPQKLIGRWEIRQISSKNFPTHMMLHNHIKLLRSILLRVSYSTVSLSRSLWCNSVLENWIEPIRVHVSFVTPLDFA